MTTVHCPVSFIEIALRNGEQVHLEWSGNMDVVRSVVSRIVPNNITLSNEDVEQVIELIRFFPRIAPFFGVMDCFGTVDVYMPSPHEYPRCAKIIAGITRYRVPALNGLDNETIATMMNEIYRAFVPMQFVGTLGGFFEICEKKV